jgi:hypothetical protein
MLKAYDISVTADWNETAERNKVSGEGNNSFSSPGPSHHYNHRYNYTFYTLCKPPARITGLILTVL